MFMRNTKKPENVEEYILNIPEDVREEFLQFREIIMKAAPDAEEGLGYGMPSLRGNKVIVYYACFKAHFSLFGYPASVVEFKERLEGYHTSKGTIQFPHGTRLPKKLITDIVKYRVKEDALKVIAKSKKRL